jgi:carbamoyl-phosphate synthase/aspartate carbamoyltransferase
MMSIGEVMAIGRTFEEVIQKACRMVNPALDGLEGEDSNLVDDSLDLETQLKNPTDTRLFSVQRAFEIGWSVDKIHNITKIDKWFLSKLSNIATMRKAVKAGGSLDELTNTNGWHRMRELKIAGFSDRQIARYCGLPATLDGESRVRDRRKVRLFRRETDRTLAAEFPAQTNYLYVTYSGDVDDITLSDVSSELTPSYRFSAMERSQSDFRRRARAYSTVKVKETTDEAKARGVIVLGCGAYCIGSSVEFDWWLCMYRHRDGFKSIIISTPKTVRYRLRRSDRLFEELSVERTLEFTNGKVLSEL